uniref:Sarcolemma associated protein n=1 Tax=Myotis myotis TaxID=51298 RepID=A0A7J7UEC3_MYOMY|nr:sarcolemma associated protein [Myotis myotis]
MPFSKKGKCFAIIRTAAARKRIAQYEKTQTVLSELKLKFEMTEQEKQSITDELKQCKDNLKLLREKGNNKPWPWMPMLAALVAVTAIVLYVPGLARASP